MTYNDDLESRVRQAFADTPAEYFKIVDRVAERNVVIYPSSFDELMACGDEIMRDVDNRG